MTVSMLIKAADGLNHSPVQVQVTRFDEMGNSQLIVDSLINQVSDLNQSDVLLQPDDHVIFSAAGEPK